jgi:hypothetical protein
MERAAMTFDLVKEPLGRVVSCARRIAEQALQTLTTAHTHADDAQRPCRDLKHFNRQLLASFPGTDIQKADIEHELNCIYEDAAAVARCAVDENAAINGVFDPVFERGGPEGDEVQHFHDMRLRALNRIDRLRAIVTQSCSRANAKVTELCTAIDNAIKGSASAAPRLAVAEIVAEPTVTDKRADNGKKTRKRLPKNIGTLMQLRKAIERGKKAGQTQQETALEFTDGDAKKAENLLRSLRRHRDHPGLD